MKETESNTIYRLPDRGIVKAPDYLVGLLPEEHDYITLYTHEGQSGSVVARRGVDIDSEGNVYHRIYDYENGADFLVPSGYTIEDLEVVEEIAPGKAQLHQTPSSPKEEDRGGTHCNA